MSGAREQVPHHRAAVPGTVHLVGAGPGDPALATQRARELVATADVVLHDALGAPALLDLVREGAEVVPVGKRGGADDSTPQESIEEQLVRHARAGRAVVRLKGGDPYVFGRGGEEALACTRHRVPVEVVPGITSAISAAAAAGIPVTHREISRSVTIVTASAGSDGEGDPDYAWLARCPGTLVLLMGLRRLQRVAESLVEHGMAPATPVAVISRGTTPAQRTVTGSLATIAMEVDAAHLAAPAIIVVGPVVELREHLAWFERRPLFGTRVAVTRARAQASELAASLAQLGAEVVECPTIRIEPLDPQPLDELVRSLATLDVLVLTSRNGVDALFSRMDFAGVDARALAGTTVAVVGRATADACRARGIEPDLMPPEGQRTSMGLLDLLGGEPLYGTRAAVVRAEQGDDRFIEGLAALGCDVSLVAAYRTVVDEIEPAVLEQVAEADLVTFTSASTVEHLLDRMPAGMRVPPAIAIGPTTAGAATWRSVEVVDTADDPSIESLVVAVLRTVERQRG